MQRYIKYPTWRVPMPLNFRIAPLQPPRYAPPSPSCPCEASGASQVLCSRRLPVTMTIVDDECWPKLTSTSAETHVDTVRYRHRHRPITITGSPLHAGSQAQWLSRWVLQSAANDREQPVGAALVVLMGRYAGGRHRPCAWDGATGSAGALSTGSRHGSAVGLSLPRSRAGCLCAWRQDGA